jgi:hypothetical protein
MSSASLPVKVVDAEDDEDSEFEIPEHQKKEFEEAAAATEASIRSGHVLPDLSRFSNWPDVDDPIVILLRTAILARDAQRSAKGIEDETVQNPSPSSRGISNATGRQHA